MFDDRLIGGKSMTLRRSTSVRSRGHTGPTHIGFRSLLDYPNPSVSESLSPTMNYPS